MLVLNNTLGSSGSGDGVGYAQGDTMANFEAAIGSDFSDFLLVGSSGNDLDGGGGDDTIAGGAGDDILHGGDGDDLIDSSGGKAQILF